VLIAKDHRGETVRAKSEVELEAPELLGSEGAHAAE
jgi:hypothetical protein